jgi:hypothetical protein
MGGTQPDRRAPVRSPPCPPGRTGLPHSITTQQDVIRHVHLGEWLDTGLIEWSAATQRKQLDLIAAKAEDAHPGMHRRIARTSRWSAAWISATWAVTSESATATATTTERRCSCGGGRIAEMSGALHRRRRSTPTEAALRDVLVQIAGGAPIAPAAR